MSPSIASGRLGKGESGSMLWATRYAVNVDLSILPHLSRHPKLIGRSIVCSTVRVSRTRGGLTSPRWRRTRKLLPVGGGRPVPSKIRQAPSGLRRPDRRNGREGEGRLFRDAGIPRTPCRLFRWRRVCDELSNVEGGEQGSISGPPARTRRRTMWLEMKVKGLALEPLSNMPMLILGDEEDKRSLPIWVGLFEANAIALELEKISPPRPMTHDLIKNILESLDARVQKIVVTDVRDNTFYAVIHLRLGTADVTVDSRPSDAIALALRVGAPIFVEEEVVHKARTVEVAKETEIGTGKGDDPAKIKEWLESLKPDDFDRIERGKDPNRPDE